MLARLRAALGGGGSTSSARRRATSTTTPASAAATATPRRSLDVAVVGAGAGGLAAARELLKEGHRPVVFEQAGAVGGTWIYDERAVDARPLGVAKGAAADERDRNGDDAAWRDAAHGSMYAGLRTNLPREVMGYLDFPFDASAPAFPPEADARRFPSHGEVLRYLDAYADAFGLRPHVRLGQRVVRATPVRDTDGGSGGGGRSGGGGGDRGLPPPPPLRWRLETAAVERDPSTGRLRPAAGDGDGVEGATATLDFDALVVANGHYAAPNLPAVAVSAGARLFPGEQLHSHSYRRPEKYAGRRVVVVGASNSGCDLADEIAAAGAELVVLSARGGGGQEGGGGAGAAAVPAAAAARPGGRVVRRGMLSSLGADGSCAFEDVEKGTVERVDAVIYATGYRPAFDFLDEAFPLAEVAGSRDGRASNGDSNGSSNGNGNGSAASFAASAAAANAPLLAWRDAPGRVSPLYLHMFPARGGLAPRLSFLGLPWKVVPFPLMQVQARLVARMLSGRAPAPLPSERAMLSAAAAAEAAAAAPRKTHMLDDAQWAYNAELLRMCGENDDDKENEDEGGKNDDDDEAEEGEAPVPGGWRARMYDSARLLKRAHPGGAYRDARWDDEGTAAEAAAEFARLGRAPRRQALLGSGREQAAAARR